MTIILTGGMELERTIYSKYSNERAKRFCIRTDIVIDEAGEKKVYKHALTPQGCAHIAQIAVSCQQLNEAYQGSAMTFCPCLTEDMGTEMACVSFSFLKGESLQDVLKYAVYGKNDAKIEHILKEYIHRVSTGGEEVPFVVTEAFETVFGTVPEGKKAITSAKVSDIDMILSNLFVEEGAAVDTPWQVIDYEWTFDFPIPKGFLIYRGLFFAYYQVLYATEWSLHRLFEMAGITAEEAAWYQSMEEHFQAYMGCEGIPVRNMQRVLGTHIITLDELLEVQGQKRESSDTVKLEEKRLHVRKIRYQIDRSEYQDGCHICSGWAFALTWDGRYLPVNIRVADKNGTPVKAEISRRERRDVADVFHVRQGTNPMWGFDCVWIAPSDEAWEIQFSLGRKVCSWERI